MKKKSSSVADFLRGCCEPEKKVGLNVTQARQPLLECAKKSSFWNTYVRQIKIYMIHLHLLDVLSHNPTIMITMGLA